MDVGDFSQSQALDKVAEKTANYQALTTKEIDTKITELEKSMYAHAQNLEFEKAAATRDEIAKLRTQQLNT